MLCFTDNDKDVLKFIGNYLKETGMTIEDFMTKVKVEQERPRKHRYYFEYRHTVCSGESFDAYSEEEAIEKFREYFNDEDYIIDSIEDEGEIED